MNTSDWLAATGIGVSATTLVAVGFGAVWLQHKLENLRVKREVFRRVVGSVHGILYDCRIFSDAHSFGERGIVAINEVRAVFTKRSVMRAWEEWYDTTLANEDNVEAFYLLVREMSAECRLFQYQTMPLEQIAQSIGCSCVPERDRENPNG